MNLQGGGPEGAYPPEAEEILRNQTKLRLFIYFFSQNLPNYELTPKLP